MIQGSDEWVEARLGRVTASVIADVMANGRSGAPSATRANLLARIVAERLSGRVAESFTSQAMQHGIDTEAQARACYTMETGRSVEEVGFVAHPTIAMAGASPDGLVGDNGLVEIKCPNTATHIGTILTGVVPDKYLKQMLFQMACTCREWCDFVSFDPRMPDEMQLFIKRVPRDPEAIAAIETAVLAILVEADDMIAKLTAAVAKEAA
jgi:putative phage-type endonuclease